MLFHHSSNSIGGKEIGIPEARRLNKLHLRIPANFST